ICSGMALGLHSNTASGSSVASSEIATKALLILGAATGARTIGFAMNRILDRHIDAKNPRTATRELPSGRMTLRQAYAVLIGALIVYEACAFAINPLCFALSPIPVVVFGIYPFLK